MVGSRRRERKGEGKSWHTIATLFPFNSIVSKVVVLHPSGVNSLGKKIRGVSNLEEIERNLFHISKGKKMWKDEKKLLTTL